MKRILVVEDSEPLGRILTQTLARAGHEAQWVGSATAAVAEASSGAPDVAVIDLHLADGDGAALVVELRATAPSCRVIGLSGEAPPADVLGRFDAFLLKPVALDTLLEAVSSG